MANKMSGMATAPRCKISSRAQGVIVAFVLALSAATSANAQPRQPQSRPAAVSIYPWDLGGPAAPPERSYAAPGSQIAPPMQQVAPIAPLSPHPAPDYSGF